MLFLYSRIREMNQLCPVLIDSEDADVVVLCAYAASVIDGELYIKRKNATINCKELCSKEMTKIVIPLHIVTGCDVTSSFFGIGKITVWKRVQKSKEARELLSNLSQDNLNRFTIKYIYNDKSSNSLGEMRAQKWKRMKTKKVKSIARIGPDEDSNTHRNDRVMYHVNVLLNFRNPSAPPNPTNHGYFILNGLCLPIMNTMASLPDELATCMMSHGEINSDPDVTESEESISSSDDDIDDNLDI